MNLASTDLLGLYEGGDYTGRYHKSAGERIQRAVTYAKLSPSDRVLDIGCGNGLLLPEIINNISRYDGVDFSKTFIRDAKRLAESHKLDTKKYNYYNESVVKFCKQHKGYDKIFALDITEHINDDEVVSIFSAVKKSMNKDALLVVHTPNKNYLLERLKSEDQKIKIQGHIALRNAAEYEVLFAKIGFSNIKAREINHYIRILKPLHILSYFPNKHISSLFKARLIVTCEV